MDAQLPLLQRCFLDTAVSARGALERCIDVTLASIEVAEGSALKLAERDKLTLARLGLLKLRGTWGSQYTAALLAAFHAGAPAGPDPINTVLPSGVAAQGGAVSGFADLTLVDDAQVTQSIEFARLSQQLRLQVDPVMADLDALVSAAQGLTRVQPERNPLRPEVFADALRGLLNATDVVPEVRALWLKGLAVPLGRELRTIYEQLIARLLDANVQAVSYQWVSGAAGAGGTAAAGTSSTGAAGGGAGPVGDGGGYSGGGGGVGGGGGSGQRSIGAGTGGGWHGGEAGVGASAVDPLAGADRADFSPFSRSGVNESLFREFLVGGADNRDPLAESYYRRIDEELAALRTEPGPGAEARPGDPGSSASAGLQGDRPARPLDGQSLLDAQVWGEYARSRARQLVRAGLRKEATHVGQVLGLEVVRKLVNEVAQDPRLLVPVREAIVALEPSLARLAMVDPRFFSDETHPGRRLMERVAQRSFKYSEEESSGFLEFFESVRRTFNALNGQAIDSAQAFNSALATLEADWTERDRVEEARCHEVLHGLRFAEDRQALADQIAYDLSSRPDLDKVPGPVLDFLYGPWSLAMAHARLVDQDRQIDPRGLGLVVSDLVWSVKRDFTLRQPAKLMDMIPGMVRKLNAGLDLIGQDPGERQAFFDILMRLHRPVLKLRRLKSELDVQESGAVPLEADLLPATAEQRVPKAAAQPWLAPHEQDDAGFEDTLPEGPAAPEDQGASVVPVGPAPPGAVGLEPMPELDMAGAQAIAPDPGQIERILAGLHTGCWVDLFSRQRWRRVQLVWASARGTLFMFVSHGGRAHSMTRRSCERLIVHDLLRPVETSGVVARALSTLTNEMQVTRPATLGPAAPAASTRRAAQPA
jgi:hypothetical protein